MKPNFIRMSSGRYIDLNNVSVDDLDIEDVNTSLNKIYRFNRQYGEVAPLTVAQHSLLSLNLSMMLEPDDVALHLAVFTHDFAESVIGDVSSPIKKILGDSWVLFAEPIEILFEQKFFGGVVDAELEQKVKMYDICSMDIERRVMWSSQYGKDRWPAAPFNLGTIEDKKQLYREVAAEDVDVTTIWESIYNELYFALPAEQEGKQGWRSNL